MKVNLLSLLMLIFFATILHSQTDSVMISADLNIADGIFLTYGDFRYNNGISKDQVVTSANKDQLDFIGKMMERETLTFTTAQTTNTISTKTAWGYVQNKTLYINYKNKFYRVPVFGAICYLVATVEIISPGFYDPMYGYGASGMGVSGRRQELREFLINFYNGVVTEFKLDDAELLISRDKELFTEYKSLSRRKQKEQISRYIRKYNEIHPVYFLK